MRFLRGLPVLALAAGLAAGCGTAAPPGAPSTPGGTAASATSVAPSASAPGSTTAPAPPHPAPASTSTPAAPAPAGPSETARLAAFFAAAEHADSQRRHAAVLVNREIGATSMRFTPATLAAARGIDLGPVAAALPAGLPTGMLRAVLVVYGDLASRSGALNGLRMYGSPGRVLPIGSPDAKSVLRGLRNGAPAAARFSGDLAAARSLARHSPRVPVAAPDSRAAAELAVRLRSISLPNICAEDFGGYAPRSLEPVVWQPSADRHSGHYAGLVNGISFTAGYTAQHGWTIRINAC